MQVSGSFSPQQASQLQATQQPKSTPCETLATGPSELEITDQSEFSGEYAQPHFLIHPATASEFREVLEPILELVPSNALDAVASQGYLIHVVDDCGLHPLTIDLEPIDPSTFASSHSKDCRTIEIDDDCSLEDVLRQQFIESRSDAESWLGPLLELNPNLPLETQQIAKGTRLKLPCFREYQGEFVRCGSANSAYELLTLPRQSYVAGMVLNEPIHGFLGPQRKVVLWDCLFRGDSRLRAWYILHELGHCLDYSCAFSDHRYWTQWRQHLTENWREQLQEGCVTRYCRESVEEYFAESFAAWSSKTRVECDANDLGDLAQQRLLLDHGELQSRDPVVCDLIEELLSRF